MPTEQLIIRRVFPVPVTDADNARANEIMAAAGEHPMDAFAWHAAIKEATGALDEVYAVIDGHEVRVAIVTATTITPMAGGRGMTQIEALLEKADEAGYWQRPHEVRHVIEETVMSTRIRDRIALNSFAVAVATEWTDALIVAAGDDQ